MYWLQYLALSSGAAILAHAGPMQKDDGAQDSGPITTTVNVKGTLMTLTVMGSPVTPTAEARVDPAPSTDSRTDLLADDATFWDWSDNYRKTPAQGPHQKPEVELYAQEMLGWEEDMQCGSADGDCVNLPTYEHINEKVKNDTLAGRIYFSMVSANNINACRRMFKNGGHKAKKLGGACQHVADQVQLPPVEHFLSLCDAGYHWPNRHEGAHFGHRHEMQPGPDALCADMGEERAVVAAKTGNSSVAVNCHFCHDSATGEKIKTFQRTYVRDFHGNVQNNYNFKFACQYYVEIDDDFYKGLADEKGCVRVERGLHP